jgi:acetyl-CoA acetyltransferase family protein
VDSVRTAGGKKNGALSKLHPADLGAIVIDALLDRNRVDGKHVDDVIVGCVSQVGAQSANIGRTMVLSSKLPISDPGTTVDRQCGSSQQAVHFAAQAVMSGVQDVVIAAGVESMSQVPIGAAAADGLSAGHGHPFGGEIIQEKYQGAAFSQFTGAELLAKKYNLTRRELDEFGWQSHVKAQKAIQAGHFRNEIVPVKTPEGKMHTQDEGVRMNAQIEQMTKLKTLAEGGIITAGTSSQICDGASAILICNEAGLKKLGLKPKAKIIQLALAGSDPVIMLEGPIPATQNALKKAGLSIRDIDLYEVNEAFAPVPVAWVKALGADFAKLNVNGGACALGHPLGGTGCKIMTTLVHEMERRGARYGLQAICEGGGTANATILERIPPTEASKLVSRL